MIRRRAGILAAFVAVSLAGRAPAQPGASSLPQPPVLPGAPAPVVPDTVEAAVVLVTGGTVTAMAIEPASVGFGGQAAITVTGSGLAAADSLVLPPWLELVEVAAAETDGLTAVVRVYGVDAFRLRQGDVLSGVVSVDGRGTDGSVTAPVRDPRRPGWNIWTILLILAAVSALVVLLSRIRRRPRELPMDRPVAGAAWPAFALGLDAARDRLARDGDTRAYVDALATAARGYAADRFRIAGREMTGAEIAEACRRLGYPGTVCRAFGRLVDELDSGRYDRGALTMDYCRERTAALLAAIEPVRLPAEPGAESEAAEAAWRRLTEAFGPGRGAAA